MGTPATPPRTSQAGHAPGAGFADAVESVLAYLRVTHPMTMWGVTRVEDGAQTHLHLGDNDYGLVAGDRVAWSETLCVHMVAGDAPQVAPDTSLVPMYRDAAVQQGLTISACAGVPIREPDGTLFGVLCGLGPSPQEDLATALPVLQLLRELLGHVLAFERALETA